MRFSERNKVTIGVVGIAVVMAVLALALNSGAIYRSLTSHSYTAAFPEAGGLLTGDEVRIGGLTVGKVGAVELDLARARVVVGFTVNRTARLGELTRAMIKTQAPLGKKFLQISPEGGGELEPGAEIPLERTNSPYDLAQVLQDLTTTTGRIDTDRLARAFDAISGAFADTPPALRSALDGVSRLSQALASRDGALRDLLANANGVTDVLAQRSQQINTLVVDGNALLDELYRRRDAIRALLVNTTAAFDQLRGAVQDNEAQIGPALDELQRTLDLLNENDRSIAQAIHGLRGYATTLGETVGGGPFFYVYVANLVPSNLTPMLPQLLERGAG
jgi:phospholipid/cholesterol/gamma-HCH transport system substrate-binding protein